MSTEEQPQSSANYDAKKYWTSRSLKDSFRLHVQHWLFLRQFGFLLHPSIPVGKTDLRVADIGCANAAWLIELSHQLPPSTQLDGFDISPSSFPNSVWMPDRVKLHVLDVLGDIPNQFVGAFDIIQVRAFTTIIKGGKTAPLLTKVSRLLKSGGYFQWIESPLSETGAIAPPGVDTEASDRLAQLYAGWAQKAGADHSWIYDMPSHLKQHNFDVIDEKFHNILPELYKPWTENALEVFAEVEQTLPSRQEMEAKGTEEMSRETYRKLFQGVLREADNGVAFHVKRLVVVVARKR